MLQLPPGHPTPAPQLLGACSISLAAAVHKVLGSAAPGPGSRVCAASRAGSSAWGCLQISADSRGGSPKVVIERPLASGSEPDSSRRSQLHTHLTVERAPLRVTCSQPTDRPPEPPRLMTMGRGQKQEDITVG